MFKPSLIVLIFFLESLPSIIVDGSCLTCAVVVFFSLFFLDDTRKIKINITKHANVPSVVKKGSNLVAEAAPMHMDVHANNPTDISVRVKEIEVKSTIST